VEPIRPVGRPHEGPAPVPAIRRLTPAEREEAARERERRRRARARAAGSRPAPGDEPPAGSGGALDVRA
jgi:ribosome assembly protein YihI (activator of Der GTPase)